MQWTDEKAMSFALGQARMAEVHEEVPIGAVLLFEGKTIAYAHNQTISSCDPTAHAEMVVIREAAKKLGNWRLNGCELFVTLEPCIMCYGAIVQARISRLIYAASEPKSGIVSSGILSVLDSLNHTPEITSGVKSEESSLLLKRFFTKKRKSG